MTETIEKDNSRNSEMLNIRGERVKIWKEVPYLVIDPQILACDIVKQYDANEFIVLLIINRAYRKLIALEIQKETEQKQIVVPSDVLTKGSENIISWAEENLLTDLLDTAYNKALSLDSPLDTILTKSIEVYRQIIDKDSIPYRIEEVLKHWYSDESKEWTKTKLQELGFNSQEEYDKAGLEEDGYYDRPKR